MSDQINEFDRIFRDRLNGQTATPPPAVWDNIQTTRSFGHVVANRISNNWRIFGTLLMLLLAGGSSVILFGEEENTTNAYQSRLIQNINHNQDQNRQETEGALLLNDKQTTPHNQVSVLKVSSNFHEEKGNRRYKKQNNELSKTTYRSKLPSPEMIASLRQAAFFIPDLEDERLTAYIQNLRGWETAEPKSFTRYYHLDQIQKSAVQRKELEPMPKRGEIDYDYVIPRVERKSFKERTSILFSFTPHSIKKTMVARYNLSSSFLEDRKKAENTRLAYTLGAQLHYELKNHKFIESGINFTQIYEEMSFEGKKRFSNQYNFVEIPLLLGYEDRNSKWGWNIKAGLGLQVFNSYQGYILKRMDEFGGTEEDNRLYRSNAVRNLITSNHTLSNNQAKNEVVDLEEEGENPFKTSGVVNLHIATGIVYYHSIKTSFLITPSYRRSINTITKKSALFTEKITYMGVSFGARMKF